MISSINDLSMNDQSIELMELAYEDHIQNDPIQAYRMVCEFLSVPCETVDVRYAAINAGLLIDLISNFDDVCDCLSTTRFAWMLEL